MPQLPGVHLLPSTGEFTYDTIAHNGQRVTELIMSPLNTYAGQAAERTDMELAIDRLIAAHPECTTVSLIVSWFFNSIDATAVKIYPSTTYINNGTIENVALGTYPSLSQSFQAWNGSAYVSDHWQCSGLTEQSSGLIPISQSSSGTFTYGGTPSDQSIVRCIEYLKSRGLRVVFYPFLLGDIPNSYPWRGRITYSGADVSTAAQAAVTNFMGTASTGQFTRDAANLTVAYSGSATDWTFRRMILHYANLCVIAGGVDLFLLGSELRGMEILRGPAWTPAGTLSGGYAVWDYPFVAALITLSDDVRGIFDGASLTKDLTNRHNLISYSPDWSSWMGWQHTNSNPSNAGQWPHLDQLYAHSNIDLICFDNYLPISDWCPAKNGLPDGGLDAAAWSNALPASWPPASSSLSSLGFGLQGKPSIYNKAYLKANIEGGEKFNWFYNDSTITAPSDLLDGSNRFVTLPQGDRYSQTREPYYAGQQLLGNKQLRWFWGNAHHAIYDTGSGWVQQGNATQWQAYSKSITFLEYGFAKTDKSTNQPNVFYDAKSSESATAYWSRWVSFDADAADNTSFVPMADPCLASIALQAIYEYWITDGHNLLSGVTKMVDPTFMCAWNWDARPFPTFSDLSTDIWGDSANWPTGLWLDGSATTGIPLSYPLTWPFDANSNPIQPQQIVLYLNQSSRSGGATLLGNEQIVASPATRWEGKIELPSMDQTTFFNWRGFVAAMNGRFGTMLMPAFENKRQTQTGVTAAAAALNATNLTLTSSAAPIIPGNRFSIAGRLYEVQQSTPLTGGQYNVNILPWLRGAIAAGTACEFVNPVSTMRFASDTEGKLDLQSNRIARPTINIIEAF